MQQVLTEQASHLAVLGLPANLSEDDFNPAMTAFKQQLKECQQRLSLITAAQERLTMSEQQYRDAEQLLRDIQLHISALQTTSRSTASKRLMCLTHQLAAHRCATAAAATQ